MELRWRSCSLDHDLILVYVMQWEIVRIPPRRGDYSTMEGHCALGDRYLGVGMRDGLRVETYSRMVELTLCFFGLSGVCIHTNVTSFTKHGYIWTGTSFSRDLSGAPYDLHSMVIGSVK